MAKNEESKVLKVLLKAFTPIVLNDKDIIEFIEKNELDQEEGQLVAFWLVSAAAGFYLSACNDPKYKNDITEAAENLTFAETQLSKKYNDIHNVLDSVLKDNIEEWFDIIHKDLQKENIESKESDNTEEMDDVDDVIAFYQKALFPIIIREDDVTEYAQQFDGKLGNFIVNFICVLILLKLATNYASDENRPNDPLGRNAMEVVKRLMKLSKDMLDTIEGAVSDSKNFQANIAEIVNDHYNEFVKKMYKSFVKQANSMK